MSSEKVKKTRGQNALASSLDKLTKQFDIYRSEQHTRAKEKGRRENWTLLLLGINAALVFATALIFWCQLRVSEQTDATLRQTMVATTRAWLTPSHAEIDSDQLRTGQVRFSIKYGNVGREPATGFVAQEEFDFVPAPRADQTLYATFPQSTIKNICARTLIAEGAGVIYPSGISDYTYTVVAIADANQLTKIPKVLDGSLAIFIHGCFAYKTFNVERKSEYCFLRLPTLDADTKQLNFRFVRCPYGNDIHEPQAGSKQ
jgi:hypothetical protein